VDQPPYVQTSAQQRAALPFDFAQGKKASFGFPQGKAALRSNLFGMPLPQWWMEAPHGAM
jgi:hypothetical protein